MGLTTIMYKLFVLAKELRQAHLSKGVYESIWNNYTKGLELKQLTALQMRQIEEYWGGVKSKVNYSIRWHQLLYTLTGVFTPEYEPFEVCGFVQDKFSPPIKQRYFDDKGLYRDLLYGFKIPTRVAECINGVYYLPEDFGQREVPYKVFIEGISNLDDCIIKPSIGTDGGRGVSSFSSVRGCIKDSKETINNYIANLRANFNNNFCIERKIKEADNLQCLNPTSCNSLRIHTYRNRNEGKIKYISSYIRIGKLGKIVDNAYSGGICGQIDDNGYIHGAKTVYPYNVIFETEAGVQIDNYKINDFEKMVETTLNAHSNLPMFDLIGWDVTVDKEGNVVIIEFNPNPDIRIEQCIFNTTCLLEHQKDIIMQALTY